MLRVVADSNIYISGLHFGGKPDKLLDLARAGSITLILSDHIVAEVSRVLREKFGWANIELDETRESLADFTELVAPQRAVDTIKDDPSDNRILECAAAAQADYIISSDKHLLRLRSFEGIPIMKVADFLNLEGGKAES